MKWGYYKTLGLYRGCTDEDERRAWKTLSRAMHPDKLMHEVGRNAAADQHAFAELVEAHQQLEEKEERSRYDRWLMMFCDPCRRCSGVGLLLSFKNADRKICPLCSGHGATIREKSNV